MAQFLDLGDDLPCQYGQVFVLNVLDPLRPDPAFWTDDASFEIRCSNVDSDVTLLVSECVNSWMDYSRKTRAIRVRVRVRRALQVDRIQH